MLLTRIRDVRKSVITGVIASLEGSRPRVSKATTTAMTFAMSTSAWGSGGSSGNWDLETWYLIQELGNLELGTLTGFLECPSKIEKKREAPKIISTGNRRSFNVKWRFTRFYKLPALFGQARKSSRPTCWS